MDDVVSDGSIENGGRIELFARYGRTDDCKNARADDCANAERGQGYRTERLFKRMLR